MIFIAFFMSNPAGVSRERLPYPTGAPGPCSKFLVALCSLLCMSVFNVWSLSLGYILLITAITLFPLVTLAVT